MTAATYTEYKTNLFTQAMGCVTAVDGSNVFADRIPLAAAKARLDAEYVDSFPTAYVVPGTHPDGLDDVTVVDKSTQTLVRRSDGRIHGRFGMESPRRQYSFLVDLAQGVTGESPADLRITGVGTTDNGGKAYMQFSTANLLTVAGMDFAPFVTVGMSHNGTLAISTVAGSQLIICSNMVANLFGMMKLKGTKAAKSRQTKNVTDAGIITRHSLAMGIAQQADEMSKALEELSNIVVTDKQWSEFVELLAPIKEDSSPVGITKAENMRETLTTLYVGDPRCEPWHGTALGALQAVNTFDIWERGTRGNTSAEIRMSDELLAGKLAMRESQRAELLQRVLVAA